MKLVDCHSHSNNSFDADASVLEMVSEAVKKGIFAYAITDHCEVDELTDPLDLSKISKSLKEINDLKQTFEHEYFHLSAGVELGQMQHSPTKSTKVLTLPGLDFVIGSLHHANSYKDYFHVDFEKLMYGEMYAMNLRYFKELYEIALKGEYDVLGHLTYPYRYIEQAMIKNPKIEIPIKHCEEIIHQILRVVVKRGKGIEINTSTLSSFFQETMPTKELLAAYQQYGGEYLSVGSDSHNTQNVGAGIQRGHEIAAELGFKYVTYYKNRKPCMVHLD